MIRIFSDQSDNMYVYTIHTLYLYINILSYWCTHYLKLFNRKYNLEKEIPLQLSNNNNNDNITKKCTCNYYLLHDQYKYYSIEKKK